MNFKLNRKKLKNAARQIHLWLGLSTGIIVFIISITGCIYVFEEEIRDATNQEELFIPIQQKPFVGLEKIISNFKKEVPKQKITSIRINEQVPNASVELSTKKKIYYFNPYDGTLINQEKQDWLVTVRKLHTNLLLGETGSFIQRWSVVIFVLMLITGIIIWFPKQIKSLKQALTIKWKGTAKRINYDLHNVLGFYASFILLIIALTGLFFAFKEVKNTAAFLTGSELTDGKKADEKPIELKESLAVRYDRIYKTAMQQYPGATTSTLSIKKNGDLRLRLLYPYNWSRKQNTFFYSPSTGQLLRYKLYKDFNSADVIEAGNYDLHTGRLFGYFGKIIAFLASLIAASLPFTGFIIWLRKKKKKSSKVQI
jgi:uncharacterized iron-regulated membrane protein